MNTNDHASTAIVPGSEDSVMECPNPLRAASYGGGVDSTTLLVLAAEGRIDFPLFLFANVGDDSEKTKTLRYVREIAKPYAAAHGIELVELTKNPTRGRFAGQQETLRKRLMHPDSRSVGIPVFLKSGAPGTRSCTVDFKIRVVAKELKRRGATAENPATVAIGITTSEIERAKPGVDEREPVQNRVYPLLDLGISRRECRRIISAAGLPIPPKSACEFCPYHSMEAWREQKRNEPDAFARSVEMERTLNERRRLLGKDEVFLSPTLVPLDQAVDDQLVLDGMGDDCDSGWCFT